MLNCIYDIFLTCDKNNCPDLVAMAQPMFLSDVQNNTREHVTDETDIGAWHEHAGELYAQSGEVGRFIGRHYDTLVEAFQARDRQAFDAVVEECIAADKAAEEKQNEA